MQTRIDDNGNPLFYTDEGERIRPGTDAYDRAINDYWTSQGVTPFGKASSLYPNITGPDGRIWAPHLNTTQGGVTPTPFTSLGELSPMFADYSNITGGLSNRNATNYGGNLYMPKDVLDAIGRSTSGGDPIQNLLNGPGPVGLVAAAFMPGAATSLLNEFGFTTPASLAGSTAPSSLLTSSPLSTGGNMSFFDDILNLSPVDTGLGDFTANDIFGTNLQNVADFTTLPNTSPFNLFPGGMVDLANSSNLLPSTGFDMFSPSGSSFLTDAAKQALKLINGSGSDGSGLDLSKLLFGSGGLSGLAGDRGFLGTALSTAPALAAINYARNQDPFDTSRLVSAYDRLDPNAVTLPYDLQTATGRTNLTASLVNRGVMGSSFGNFDLNSYNTLRDVGRSNLLTGSIGTQANIANQILQAEIASQKNKNDLYGRALLALSGGLSPRTGAALIG